MAHVLLIVILVVTVFGQQEPADIQNADVRSREHAGTQSEVFDAELRF